MSAANLIDSIRAFNRFYTSQIGLLQESLLGSGFSLTEARVFYELGTLKQITASQLGADLALDAGYLSRILSRFAKLGFIRKERSAADARQSLLSISAKGRSAFNALSGKSNRGVQSMIASLSESQQASLVDAMRTIRQLLAPSDSSPEPYVLRSHRPGDLGWVVHRHGAIYAREYGYDQEFEGLVAGIVTRFAEEYDARYDRCWIAERGGEILGFIFLIKDGTKSKSAKKPPTVAKLRLFLIEASARGMGLGRRLVQECVQFARQTGYRKITLSTHQDLYAARHLYQEAGFRCVESAKQHDFGKDLVAETWELDL